MHLVHRAGWAVAFALAVALLAAIAGVVYGGPLDPPGAPAPTQHNLIYQPSSCGGFPIVLNAPGSYALAQDINGCSGIDGIDITSSDVSLDLAGFTLKGATDSGIGIHINSGAANGAVRNGIIESWQGAGIQATGSKRQTFENLTVSVNTQPNVDGIVTSDSIIRHCQVITATNTAIKIAGGIVDDCKVGGGGVGIDASGQVVVSNVQVQDVDDTGIFISNGGVLRNCAVTTAALAGIRAQNATVTDCTVAAAPEGIRATASTVRGCTLSNAYLALTSNSSATGCTVTGNNSAGIYIGAGSRAESNTVSGNLKGGIVVSGEGASVINNTVVNNGAAYNGIDVSGSFNRIDSNSVEKGLHAIEVGGANNVIVRNTGGGTSASVFDIVGANNTFGPTQTQASPLTNPWANISH